MRKELISVAKENKFEILMREVFSEQDLLELTNLIKERECRFICKRITETYAKQSN